MSRNEVNLCMSPPKVTTRSLFTCLTHHESVISPPSSGPLRTIARYSTDTAQIQRQYSRYPVLHEDNYGDWYTDTKTKSQSFRSRIAPFFGVQQEQP
eukprot:3052041-Prymnesium_polylepis.1